MSPDPSVVFDFSAMGGVATIRAGADPADPGAIEWNFGVSSQTPEVAADAGPSLYDRFPNIQGKWDGKSTINIHESVRKVLGKDLKAQYQPRGTCFPAGTLVLMADGTEKPIESVQVGDVVCTHVNTARRVLRTMQRDYTGEMTYIRVRGVRSELSMTDEHPVLVIENGATDRRRPDKYVPGRGVWRTAASLAETERVMLPFGVRNSYCLRVPELVFSAPAVVKLAVIRGWMDGDGSVCRVPRVGLGQRIRARGTSASVRLVRDMQRLSALVGVRASVTTRKQERHQRTASNDAQFYGNEALLVSSELRDGHEEHRDRRGVQFHRNEHGFVVPITQIRRDAVVALPVYNLEVEEEHTYVANGVAVHNCGSRSGSRALDLLQCGMISAGKRAKFYLTSHAWIYYLARREYNMLGRGDGVASGSVPVVLGKYGATTREEANDLDFDSERSDDLAVKWGAGRIDLELSRKLTALASDNLVTAMVTVRSAQEMADGLAAGGVGICSDSQGYSMTRDADGACAPKGTWYHYHVRSGLKVTPRGRRLFAYDQSWGASNPSGPLLEGWASNCFGVDWEVMDRTCRNGDASVLFAMDLWDLESGNIDIPWLF